MTQPVGLLLDGTENHRTQKYKPPPTFVDGGFYFRRLAMTYSHMGRPHTTIGDASFHC